MTFLTSLQPLHGFASNFMWMFLRWAPTEFDKILGAAPIFHGIMSNVRQFLKNLWDLVSSLFK